VAHPSTGRSPLGDGACRTDDPLRAKRSEETVMGTYLMTGSYTAEGAAGVLRTGGSDRRDAARVAIESMGGTLQSFHFALGGDEWYVIVDLPDNVAAAAIALVGTASGTLRTRAIPLITPEEMDGVVGRVPDFRPPGA
jgi:uncharacterized protein with GYD domain